MCISNYDKMFGLNHDKSLLIYAVCENHQAKNDFMKDVESRVSYLNEADKLLSSFSATCLSFMGLRSKAPGPEVILFFMLSSDEHEIFHANISDC